jgi:hypothetical protein
VSPVREALAAAAGFLVLSAAFQAPGLSPDGLLSDASALRSRLLWTIERPELARPPRPLDDYVRYFAPYAAFIQRELRAGRLPLWNPYIGTGYPVAEALQPALLHPFTVLLLVVPYEHALTLMAVIRLGLAGAGTFVLARALGCGGAAAGLAGTLFMFSPIHLNFRFSPLANVTVLLPWMLAASELRLRGARPRRIGAAWSLLGTLAILGGHAESIAHTFGLVWVYHLARASTARAGEGLRRRLGSALLFLTACTILAALGAAGVIWGHTQVVLDSQVMRLRTSYGAYPVLPLDHLRSFLIPTARHGLRWGAYLGLLTLVLAGAGIVGRGPFAVWPWLAIGTGGLLTAYGVWPVPQLLRELPLVGVADHTRLILVAHLALALLVARGVESLRRAAPRRALGWAAVAGALGLAVHRVPPWPPIPTFHALFGVALVLGFGALLIASAPWAARRAPWAWMLAGIVLLDLYGAHGPQRRRRLAAFPPAPPVTKGLTGSAADGRVFVPDALLPVDVGMVYALPSISGYEMTPDRTRILLAHAGLRPSILGVEALGDVRPEHLRLLSLLNVRHLILPRPLAGEGRTGARLEDIGRGPIAIYRNPDAFPRAFAVQEVRLAGTVEEALALVTDPGVDLRRVAVVEEPPRATSNGPRPTDGPAPRTSVRAYRPGRTHVDVDCPADCHLVLSETFWPGWRATVDGRPAPVVRADYALVGVPVPAGRHEVVLAYRPLPVIAGSVIGLTVVLALAVAVLVPAGPVGPRPRRQ